MKKQNKRRGQEGFTLIEVIVSTALLAVAASGFLMMAGANVSLLAREHRLERSNYELEAMAEEGEGESTGGGFVMEFHMENDREYAGVGAEEQFGEYRVSMEPEDMGGSMTFYRYR